MTDIIQAVILGIIQGITEWLPVSSSGHLVIFQQLFQLGTPLIFDIMLHVATLLVILIVFWKDVLKMAKALLRLDFKDQHGFLALLILVGSVPTFLIGYFFQDFFESLFTNIEMVGLALVANGVILYLTKGREGKRRLGYVDALLIGTAQGIAIIPGISRSGITISTGLFAGIERKALAAFSFLLSVPAIMGAAVLKSGELAAKDFNYLALLVGMLVSVIVGYFALRLLLRMLLSKKLHKFAPYCIIVGLLLLAQSI